MQTVSEYQIYVGCNDSQTREELVTTESLQDIVSEFFRRKKIDFSIYQVQGGYVYGDGSFVTENALCINMVGSNDEAVEKLVRSLSMFMNQEYTMVVKKNVQSDYQ